MISSDELSKSWKQLLTSFLLPTFCSLDLFLTYLCSNLYQDLIQSTLQPKVIILWLVRKKKIEYTTSNVIQLSSIIFELLHKSYVYTI